VILKFRTGVTNRELIFSPCTIKLVLPKDTKLYLLNKDDSDVWLCLYASGHDRPNGTERWQNWHFLYCGECYLKINKTHHKVDLPDELVKIFSGLIEEESFISKTIKHKIVKKRKLRV
jgi:hypothetical protein